MQSNVEIIWYTFENGLKEIFEQSRQENYIFQVLIMVKMNALSFTELNICCQEES